jgi:hypothetical protein
MNLQSSWTALDLGCGDAFYVSKLLRESQLGKSLRHYVGVDMSRAALTYADRFLHEALPAEAQVRPASPLSQAQLHAMIMMLRKMPSAQARAPLLCGACSLRIIAALFTLVATRSISWWHATHGMQHAVTLLMARCSLSSRDTAQALPAASYHTCST